MVVFLFILFLNAKAAPNGTAFEHDVLDVAEMAEVMADVAILHLDIFTARYADERTLVVEDLAIAEKDVHAAAKDELGEFLVAGEDTVVEQDVAALVDIHDLIGAVADDAVGELEFHAAGEVDTFHAASIEVAVVDGDIPAVLECNYATLAIAAFGMSHDEIFEPDIVAVGKAQHVGIAGLDAQQGLSALGAANSQVVNLTQIELHTIVLHSEIGIVGHFDEFLQITLVIFAIDLDLVGIVLCKVLELVLEVDVVFHHDDAVAAQGMDERDGIIDMDFLNLLREGRDT